MPIGISLRVGPFSIWHRRGRRRSRPGLGLDTWKNAARARRDRRPPAAIVKTPFPSGPGVRIIHNTPVTAQQLDDLAALRKASQPSGRDRPVTLRRQCELE